MTVELRGFEAAFLEWLSAGFRFSGADLASFPLTTGRTFFANFMPEVAAIAASSAADAMPYDATKEPTVTVYTNATPGGPASSTRSRKQETTLQIVLRVAGSFERAKALLEELVAHARTHATGKRMSGFITKKLIIQQRPTAFQRQNDDRSFAQASIRFLYVSLNQ